MAENRLTETGDELRRAWRRIGRGVERPHGADGDFTLARNAACEKTSGDVTIVRTTSRMSPSVRRNVAAARSTSACGGWSLTNRTASFRAMNFAVDG